MGKKGLAAILFSKPKLPAADGSPSPPWQWPSCASNPQTASFRRQRHHEDAGGDDTDRPCSTAGRPVDDMYKTVNSVYFDPAAGSCFFDDEEDGDDALDDCLSYSTTTASEEWSEAVIRSLGRASTDRFFFDAGPPPASNSILAASRSPSPSPARTRTTTPPPEPKKAAPAGTPDRPEGDSDEEDEVEDSSSASPLVEESVAVALESEDPYGDFRASMEEMVAAHGLRDWASLQEMLLWYLRINAKHNHALIVGAFVDLLVGLAAAGSRRSAAAATTTTTVTMTTTTTTAATATTISSSSSSSSSSVAGDGATCSSTAAIGGGSGTDASCSPAVSSSDQEEDEEELDREKASDELALCIKL